MCWNCVHVNAWKLTEMGNSRQKELIPPCPFHRENNCVLPAVCIPVYKVFAVCLRERDEKHVEKGCPVKNCAERFWKRACGETTATCLRED